MLEIAFLIVLGKLNFVLFVSSHYFCYFKTVIAKFYNNFKLGKKENLKKEF